MTNRRYSKFQRGTGVYHCIECNKLTRDTGYGEGGTGLCKKCFISAEYDNAVQDGTMTREQVDIELAEIFDISQTEAMQ